MGIIGQAFTAITGISKGDITQKMCQALGMDRQSAALMGAMTDFKSGNLVGFHQNLTEGLTGRESGGLNAAASAMLGSAVGGRMGVAAMAAAQSVGAPGLAMMGATAGIAGAALSGGLLGTAGGAMAGYALGGGLGGAMIGALAGSVVSRGLGACCMGRAARNPLFAGALGAALGGTLLGGGSMALGALTFMRPGFSPFMPGLMPGAFRGIMSNNVTGGVLGGMNKMMNNATGLTSALGYAGMATIQGRQVHPGEMRIRANARADGELAKLPTPATFEDLIAAFMMDVMMDMQDEMKEKMAEYEKMKPSEDQNKQGAATNGGGKAGKGGMFGSIFGGLGKIVGGIGGGLLGSLVSPFLGTAVGGGLGAGLGGMVGNLAGGIIGLPFSMLGMGGIGGGGGTTAAAGNQQTALGENKGQATDEKSRQILFEKIKDLMQKMQQMFQSLSNVLNTMHQGAMNSIRNIRA
jgi:hypothetical protein